MSGNEVNLKTAKINQYVDLLDYKKDKYFLILNEKGLN